MDTKEIFELENRFRAKDYKPLDVVLEKGKEIWVCDIEGNKYMDCLAAYSAVNQGIAIRKLLTEISVQTWALVRIREVLVS